MAVWRLQVRRCAQSLASIAQVSEVRYVRPWVGPRPTHVGKLPKYRFHQTGVGCAKHNKPECLCDVNVSEETPVTTQGELMFSTLATKVHGHPTKENFVDWASTLLGCFETERILVDHRDEQGVFSHLPYIGSSPNMGWFMLGPEVREDFRWYATRKGFTFGMLEHLVPESFTVSQRNHVRKLFNKYKTDHNNRKKASAE